MFERFTEQARRVVVLAQEEARILNHNYIGTEHFLLGLLHDGTDSVAAAVLGRWGVTLDTARRNVEDIVGRGGSEPSGHIPFTVHAKKVLELSLREAQRLGDDHIGTEHILLGLVHEGDGVAAQVLDRLGVDRTELRQAVESGRLPERYSSQGGTLRTAEPMVRCPGCDFETTLVRAPQELNIRIERSDEDPRFRLYVTSGGVERLVHECESDTTAP